MKIKRNKMDIAFSQLVRNRAGWRCEHSGVDKSDDPGTLDCAHIMGRRGVALRWHPANAIALSRSSHIFFTEHPFDWRDFCIHRFGEDRVAELRLVSNQPVKWTKKMREEIYKHMKEQMKVQALGGDFEPHEYMHKFES